MKTSSLGHPAAAIALAALAGCATVSNPVPEGYTGPVVPLADSGFLEDGSRGQFFAVTRIDGNAVRNTLGETRRASEGKGFSLSARYTVRDVPVRPMKLTLVGTHQTAAPIHEIASRMAGTFFSVEGVVDFTPAAGRRYETAGELKKERSCVWVLDAESRAPATDKVCTP